MRRILPLLAILIASTSHAQSAAPVVALDEASVVAYALDTHPALDAAEATADAARAGAQAATRARVPELAIEARYTRLSSIPARYRNLDGIVFPQLLDSLGVRATLSVPITDTFLALASAARAADADADAARIELEVARAQIAHDARVAFYTYWGRVLAVQNAHALVQAALANVEDQRRRATSGAVAPNDVISFESALESAAMALERATADRAAADALLRIYLPALGDAAIGLPDLPAPEPLGPTPDAPAEPPRLAALEARAQAAAARAQNASRARLPRLSGYFAGDIAAPTPRVFVLDRLTTVPTWEAGLRIEWNLSQATVGSARTAQARAEHAAYEARLAEARLQWGAERVAATSALASAQARFERSGTRVAHASALVAARRVELASGRALPIDVVLAEADLTRASDERVQAFVDRGVARAKLDLLDGLTLVRGDAR